MLRARVVRLKEDVMDSRVMSGWRSVAYAALSLTFVGLAACGDSEINTNAPINRDGDPGGTPTVGDAYLLVANGPTERPVALGATSSLEVLLIEKLSGDPVTSQEIRFEITEGSEYASLAALASQTDEAGLGRIDLRVGQAEGNIKVTATHASANPVEFTLSIEPRATGDIKVSLVNSAPSIMPLQQIDVRLHDSADFSCDEFLPLRQQPETDQFYTVPTVRETVDFVDLDVEKKYVVTGIARGNRLQIAAGGCVDDVRVASEDVTDVEVGLALVPLNPVGRYDVTSNWDFTNAVAESGPVGATIVSVLNIFIDPGQALYDGIIDLVDYAVGGIIGSAINTFLNLTGLDDYFKDLVNDAIDDNDTLSQVRDAGRDLRDVIANLEVSSELVIGKLSSSYEFTGTDNWLGVTLYWRWNCDANSPPDCGAIPIVAEDGSDFANLGVLSSVWNGRVVAYDQLQIDTHPITLRYGRLIIYVLNNVIIPQLTGGNASSLSEAFAYWIGCDRLATSITGSDGEVCALGACLRADQIEGFCTSTVTTLFGFADAAITNLEFDIGLTVGGEGKLIEETSDGFVDKIEEGTYTGTLAVGNQQGGGNPSGGASTINATWTGIKLDFQTNNQ